MVIIWRVVRAIWWRFGAMWRHFGAKLVPNWVLRPAKMVGLLSSVGVEVSVEKKENTTDKE